MKEGEDPGDDCFNGGDSSEESEICEVTGVCGRTIFRVRGPSTGSEEFLVKLRGKLLNTLYITKRMKVIVRKSQGSGKIHGEIVGVAPADPVRASVEYCDLYNGEQHLENVNYDGSF